MAGYIVSSISNISLLAIAGDGVCDPSQVISISIVCQFVGNPNNPIRMQCILSSKNF